MDPDMVLRFGKFKLSETEGGEVALNSADIRASREACEGSLVGKIYGGVGVNFTGLKQTMSKLWCKEGSLKMVELKNKKYQFFFSNEDEKRRVLEKRPWTFENQMLVLLPWKQDIEKDEKLFHFSPMWVQVWEIPPQWLTSETVWKVGKVFKQVSNVIIPETGSKDGRFAKMLVEVDLSKPLTRGINLSFEGDKRWILFKYELLPLFCFYCGKIGHAERSCGLKTEDGQNGILNVGQFGEWMRAVNGRASVKGRTINAVGPRQLNSIHQRVGESEEMVQKVADRIEDGRTGWNGQDQVSERMNIVSEGNSVRGSLSASEGKTEGEDKLATKENKPDETTIKSGAKGRGGENAAEEDVRDEVRSGEDSRVLQELDQNNAVTEALMSDRKTTGGTWKRKIGSISKKGRSEGGEEQRKHGMRPVSSGKRGFLFDEEDSPDKENQEGKKQKMDEENMIICHNLVEEASHNWPQRDQ